MKGSRAKRQNVIKKENTSKNQYLKQQVRRSIGL
jgi:hypothetical protein